MSFVPKQIWAAAGGAILALAPAPAFAQDGPGAPVSEAEAQGFAGSSLRTDDLRVGAIVYRLGYAGRAFCPEAFPLTGLLFHHLAEYDAADRPEAIRRFGVDRGPGVLAVVGGSPAARAGLRAGDVLLSVNGRPFPSPVAIASEGDARRWRPLVEASETILEDELRRGPARIQLLRSGETLDLSLQGVPGCAARARLARSSQANAFADGRYAIMTTRLLPFFRDDQELAVAMAHELAHNILGHPARLEEAGVPYNFTRHLGRNAALVRATEEEADRLAVKLLWAAGYDLSVIMPFWRRFAGRLDSQLQVISAHPGLRRREEVINAAIAELSASAAD